MKNRYNKNYIFLKYIKNSHYKFKQRRSYEDMATIPFEENNKDATKSYGKNIKCIV